MTFRATLAGRWKQQQQSVLFLLSQQQRQWTTVVQLSAAAAAAPLLPLARGAGGAQVRGDRVQRDRPAQRDNLPPLPGSQLGTWQREGSQLSQRKQFDIFRLPWKRRLIKRIK